MKIINNADCLEIKLTDLNFNSAQDFKKKISKEMSNGKSGRVLFDFSSVLNMDTGGLALLIFIVEKYGESKEIIFSNVPVSLKHIFKLDERIFKIAGKNFK
ncbi:MAG TPA: STAS domain-containing protein [bacterium]|nr:STAS domain-containing protein [bacterium]HPN29808.1 STAS domain-containing protein [bacterium]